MQSNPTRKSVSRTPGALPAVSCPQLSYAEGQWALEGANVFGPPDLSDPFPARGRALEPTWVKRVLYATEVDANSSPWHSGDGHRKICPCSPAPEPKLSSSQSRSALLLCALCACSLQGRAVDPKPSPPILRASYGAYEFQQSPSKPRMI